MDGWPAGARVRERSEASRWQIEGTLRFENGYRASVMVLLGVTDPKYYWTEAKALYVSPICKTKSEADEWLPDAEVVCGTVARKQAEMREKLEQVAEAMAIGRARGWAA